MRAMVPAPSGAMAFNRASKDCSLRISERILAGTIRRLRCAARGGICHTELDEIEGRLPAKLPIILGHQIVGSVAISPGQWPGYPRREAGAKAWESPG